MNIDAAKVGDSEPAKGDALRSIKAVCPQCHRKYRLDERYAGRRLKCRSCGEKVEVSRKVEIVTRPAAEGPTVLVRILKTIADVLMARRAKMSMRRSRWLTSRQARMGAVAIGIACVLALVVGVVRYWDSDAAKIRFSRQQGKEIAVRHIVELQEELAVVLADIKSPADAEPGTDRIEKIVTEQGELWETLSAWKIDGFLTDGELSLLRTRYRDRYKQAVSSITEERLRIGRTASVNQQVLAALGSRGSDVAVARRHVLGAGGF